MPKDTTASAYSLRHQGAQAIERAFNDYELALLAGAEPRLTDCFAPQDVPCLDLRARDPGAGILPFASEDRHDN